MYSDVATQGSKLSFSKAEARAIEVVELQGQLAQPIPVSCA